MSNSIRTLVAAAGLLGVAVLAAAGLLVVAEAPAHADCLVSGPSTANVNQSFTLCGPSNSASTYEWSGPGINTNPDSRCVTVNGLAQGGYEYLLIRRVNGAEVERCTRVINVGGSTGGVASCQITGPETIDAGSTATLCAPQDGLHDYTWTSPSGATSTASCITVRDAGTYTLQSRNRLTGSSRTCTRLMTVNGYQGDGDCDITGPTMVSGNTTVQLCAPSYANVSYRWTGPNGFVGSTSCINVGDPGTYALTMRNLSTGRTTSCSRQLTTGSTGSACDISGPTTIPYGSSAQLCAPSFYANTSYRWTGPGGFTSSSRCIAVSRAGEYVLTLRDVNSGRTTRCVQAMSIGDQGGYDDPDSPVSGCPRDLQYWRSVVAANGTTDLNRSELLAIAREVDNRSSYLNWTNDVSGLRSALSPGQTLTRRKQVIRQFAALLANVAAGELSLASDDGNEIGLDMETAVNFGGAHTVGELIALTDRLLTANRGDFAKLNATLNQINRGRGIGLACQ